MARDVLSRWAPQPDNTVTYGAHPDHVIDIRRPASPPRGMGGSTGLVVFLHGGFWRQAYDRTHTGPLATALAAAGFTVATPEFRRTGAPGGGWPGTFDDVAAAVRAAPALVAEVTGDAPERVILAGHSAGGQLALWAAAGLARDGIPPAGVVALAPVADLAGAYRLDLDGGAVAALLGGGPDDYPDRFSFADPMALVPLGVRQVLCHGGRDRQVPPALSRRYADSARAAGDEVDLFDWVDSDHFDLIDPESPVWPDVLAAFALLAPPEARPLR